MTLELAEVVEVLSRTPDALRGLLLGASDAWLDTREGPESFSPRDVVGHLIFGEETDWCRRMRDAGWKLMFAPVGEITHHGSASVRKLNHRRDLMLTEAKVRLHRKHGGIVPAGAVWLIAGLFNGSRAVFWAARRALGDARADERARHFRGVVIHLRDAWPAPPQ